MKKQTYSLHYIGMGMYTTSSFIEEAKRLGVQRALSFSFLQNLKWGQPILLARYIPKPKPKLPKTTKTAQNGTAEVFGYMTLNGLTNNLPPAVMNQLSRLLKLKEQTTPLLGNRTHISRACGSYDIGTTLLIQDTLKELLDKIKTLIDDPNDFKWFITGEFHTLTSFILDPAKFARGLTEISIHKLDIKKQSITSANLVWLYNYRRREYMPKNLKNRFGPFNKKLFGDKP